MKYLCFDLSGDMAMWRNPYEPVASFSTLGPAPSQIAGLIGAALGFPAPWSQAAGSDIDKKSIKESQKKGLYWPVSPELLRWQDDNDYAVACRWKGGIPSRIPWNVNGVKELNKPFEDQPLRLQQQVVDNPLYQVLLRLKNTSAIEQTADALCNPAFPLYLGASFCRAVVRNPEIRDTPPPLENGSQWAFWKESLTVGEITPFSRHVVNDREKGERIVTEGFWVYPTPMHPAEKKEEDTDPCLKGYCYLSD